MIKKNILTILMISALLSSCKTSQQVDGKQDTQNIIKIDELSKEMEEKDNMIAGLKDQLNSRKRNENDIERADEIKVLNKSFPYRPNKEINLEYVKTNLRVGASNEEIIKSFGQQFIQAIGQEFGELEWVYDFVAIPDYVVEHAVTGGRVVSLGDIEGIRRGDISLQLFISWTNQYNDETVGSVSKFTVIFKDGNSVKAIHYGKEGSIKEEKL